MCLCGSLRGPMKWTQVLRLTGKCLCPLSNLIGPEFLFFLNLVFEILLIEVQYTDISVCTESSFGWLVSVLFGWGFEIGSYLLCSPGCTRKLCCLTGLPVHGDSLPLTTRCWDLKHAPAVWPCIVLNSTESPKNLCIVFLYKIVLSVVFSLKPDS